MATLLDTLAPPGTVTPPGTVAPPGMPPPPGFLTPPGSLASPDRSFAVIRVDALEAALANLNITGITASQLLDAVKKEEKTPPPPLTGRERRKAMLARKDPDTYSNIYPNHSYSMI